MGGAIFVKQVGNGWGGAHCHGLGCRWVLWKMCGWNTL